MGLNLVNLLVHSEAVPLNARDALRAASELPPHQRRRELESAARSLFLETDLTCRDAREIVGLPSGDDCGCRA
jgi:hypothetical protein